jgi:hypothetical protein
MEESGDMADCRSSGGVNFVQAARIFEGRRQGVATKHGAEGKKLLEAEIGLKIAETRCRWRGRANAVTTNLSAILVLNSVKREKRCWITKRQARRSVDVLAPAAPDTEGGYSQEERSRSRSRKADLRKRNEAELSWSSGQPVIEATMVCERARVKIKR